MMFKEPKGLAWQESTGVLGTIKAVDFEENMVTIQSETGNIIIADVSDVVYLDYISEYDGFPIYDHDVFEDVEGNTYEITLDKEKINLIYLYSLNEDYERVGLEECFGKENLSYVLDDFNLTLIESLFTLESRHEDELNVDSFDLDFNIKIVREVEDNSEFDETTYYYACNNQVDQEIDLIKVIFIGSQLFEEEMYERFTLSYEDFQEAIEQQEIEEVAPLTLFNHVNQFSNDILFIDKDDEWYGDVDEDEEDYY